MYVIRERLYAHPVYYLYLFTVFLNEERNEIGDRAFQVALDYVKKNTNLGIEIGEVITVVGNTTDAQSFLQSGKCNSISTKYVTC